VFDPEFNDARLAPRWTLTGIEQVPVGGYPGGYEVRRQFARQVEVFGRPLTLSTPLDVRLLFDTEGRLWMSDVPQERLMMYHNGQASAGHILVGGLGLALYPQYAAHQATRFTIVERSWAVMRIVTPTLERALERRSPTIPFEIVHTDIEDFLQATPMTRYDTIFLDTWDTLDAANLPHVNRLRDLAENHLAPNGRTLLWGYRWMVGLFEEACRILLDIPPSERAAWLAGQSPAAQSLLAPVAEKFADQVDMDDATLAWCRAYAWRV
jgi:hypothetical protein